MPTTTLRLPRPTGAHAGLLSILVVVGAAVVALAWDLDALGWGNQYYAAVAQSGAASEWGFFNASPDLAAVTGTDKPPLAFWPMSVAVWLFGLHGWAIALPQVAESAAAVALLALTVRRVSGAVGATVAAAALASTPIFFVLARFDDPDTLLTLCITGGAYAAVRACESPTSRRWLILLGASLGLAFLTKWLTAAIPAPALIGAVLWSRRTRGARLWSSVTARPVRSALVWVSVAAGVVGLPWVLARWVIPLAHRPQLDSATNSLVDVITSQNGVSRFALTRHDAAAVAIQGVPGPLRLVTPPFAGQIGWLIPLAVACGAIALVRVVRGAKLGSGWLVLGGWFALTAVVFSLMGGNMHPYYTVLMAPAVAGVVGLGMDWAWRRRAQLVNRVWGMTAGIVLVASTTAYAAAVLDLTPHLRGWSWPVLASGVVSSLALLAAGRSTRPVRQRALTVAAATALVAGLAGPSAYAASTFGHPVVGANPIAGPVSGSGDQAAYPAALVTFLAAHRAPGGWLAAAVTSTAASELQLQSDAAVLPLGGFTGHAEGPGVADLSAWVTGGRLRYLVLTGPYYRGLATPANLRGTSLAAVMDWAATHSCPATVPTKQYLVLDLTCRSSHHTG